MDLLTLQIVPTEEVTSDTSIDMAILDNKAMADEAPMMKDEAVTTSEEVTEETVNNEIDSIEEVAPTNDEEKKVE